MGRIQTINYNHYEEEGPKLEALIVDWGHYSTVFSGISTFSKFFPPGKSHSQQFPSPWRAGPDTILQAEKSGVLVAGTPQISRTALERGWMWEKEAMAGLMRRRMWRCLCFQSCATSTATLAVAFSGVLTNAPNSEQCTSAPTTNYSVLGPIFNIFGWVYAHVTVYDCALIIRAALWAVIDNMTAWVEVCVSASALQPIMDLLCLYWVSIGCRVCLATHIALLGTSGMSASNGSCHRPYLTFLQAWRLDSMIFGQ